MNDIKQSPLYKTGYNNGYYDGMMKALKFLSQSQPKTVNITININDVEEVNETESEEKQALKFYKDILFGGCNGN